MSIDPADDLSLVRQAGFQSPEKMYEFTMRTVRSWLRPRMRDQGDLDDLAHEVWMAAWIALGKTFHPSAGDDNARQTGFRRFLGGITRNVFARVWRERYRAQESASQPAGPVLELDIQTPLDIVLQHEAPAMLPSVHAALDRLPADSKEILEMRYLMGLPFKDIVELMDLPLNTLQTRCSRALKKLQSIIENDFPDLDPREGR